MKLTRDMSLEEFRDEMQVRAFKHADRSKPVREALRFARQHPDPAFYRVALDKVDAQKQFRHELFGPSRWQKLLDVLSGTPKDVAVTLSLIFAVLTALSFMRSHLLEPPAETMREVDIDRLAERMGLLINDRSSPENDSERWTELDETLSQRIDDGIELAEIDAALVGKLNDVIDQSRLGELAAARVGESLKSADLKTTITAHIEEILQQPSVKQAIVAHIEQQLKELDVKGRIVADLTAALDEAKIETRIVTHVDAQLQRMDREIAARTSTVASHLKQELESVISKSHFDKAIAAHLNKQLARLDERFAAIDKHLTDRIQQLQRQTSEPHEPSPQDVPSSSDAAVSAGNIPDPTPAETPPPSTDGPKQEASMTSGDQTTPHLSAAVNPQSDKDAKLE